MDINFNSSLKDIQKALHSPRHNYVIPGLTSYLIEGSHNLRIFHNTRNHQESISPHTHRFNFRSKVLEGIVTNVIWEPSEYGDAYQCVDLSYCHEIGQYVRTPQGLNTWKPMSTIHRKGAIYDLMDAYFRGLV
jgi:hypothetical protein